VAFEVEAGSAVEQTDWHDQEEQRFLHKLSSHLDAAVIAESARWGDYRRDVHQYKEGPYDRYTRDKHWRPEVKRLLEDYFPNRTKVFVEQLKAAQLYP
jgi:hypothetical protein